MHYVPKDSLHTFVSPSIRSGGEPLWHPMRSLIQWRSWRYSTIADMPNPHVCDVVAFNLFCNLKEMGINKLPTDAVNKDVFKHDSPQDRDVTIHALRSELGDKSIPTSPSGEVPKPESPNF